MKQLFKWSSHHPLLSFGLALLVTVIFSIGLPRLKIDAALTTLMRGSDPRIGEFKNVAENFKERTVALVLVRSSSLFTPDVFKAVSDLADRFERIKGVEETSSIFNVIVPQARGGVAFAGKIVPSSLLDEKALAALREELLANSIVRDQLLTRRGDVLAIVLFLEPEGPARRSHDEVLLEMREIRSRFLADRGDGTEIVFLGVPVVKADVWDRLNWDLRYLGPLSLIAIASLIFLFYRSASAVFLPLLTGILSSFATLGFMGFAGYPVNTFLSIIIVFNLVLGCTEDLHILSEFRRNFRDGISRLQSIEQVGVHSGHALLMTSATTTLGFLSMVVADNLALREFAISCSFAMAINFVITILTVPALLALLPLRKPSSAAETRPRSERYAHAFVDGLQHRKRIAFLVGFGLVLLAIAAIPRIEIDSDYFDFCPEDSEAVRAKDFCSRHFEGGSYLTVVMETHTSDGIFSPEGMKSLYLLHGFLERECGHPFGWVNYMNEFQASLGRPLPTAESPPGDAELTSFGQFFLPSLLKTFLDFDNSRSAIRLRVVARGSKDTAAIEARILDFARANLPDGIEVRITGEKSLIDRLSDAIAEKLFENLAGLCFVTAVLISVYVRSWKQGFVFLIVNLIPVAAIYGAMGWLSIPLGLGTCAVALIVFGIAVDDTIHLILRYNKERGSGKPPPEAAASALCLELHPIVATSVIICGGIIVVMFSPAPINSDVGILFVIGTATALAADVFLTPLLIVLAERPRQS